MTCPQLFAPRSTMWCANVLKPTILKAHAVLSKVELPEEWETMTRGRRNLAPQQERGTTVNVSQQASAQTAAVATSVPAPDSALREALRGSYEAD